MFFDSKQFQVMTGSLQALSMQQQMIEPSPAATPFQAMAARVETPIAGFCAPQHRPFTAATPMRMPVNEPGPRATATASTSASFVSVFFKRSSTMGSSVRLCVSPEHWVYCPRSSPSRQSAAEAAFAEDSSPSISMGFSPPLS